MAIPVFVTVPRDRAEYGVGVDLVIAVIVQSITVFDRTGVGRHRVVITVGVVGHVSIGSSTSVHHGVWVAIAVTVQVGVPRCQVDSVLIDLTIAVIVVPIAAFFGGRMAHRFGIIAVEIARGGSARDIAIGRGAGLQRGRSIAVAIPVCVQVPRGCKDGVFIDNAITVIVLFIAYLVGVRVDERVSIITVTIGDCVAIVVRIQGVEGRTGVSRVFEALCVIGVLCVVNLVGVVFWRGTRVVRRRIDRGVQTGGLGAFALGAIATGTEYSSEQ
jgi:hypothetical protein